MFNQPFHDFDTHNAILSEGAPLSVVVGDFHETQHQRGDNTDFPRPLRIGEARLRLACPFGEAQTKTWSQFIAVNLALTAVGVKVRLPPWPARGEVALPDLVRATDPSMVTLFCRRC